VTKLVLDPNKTRRVPPPRSGPVLRPTPLPRPALMTLFLLASSATTFGMALPTPKSGEQEPLVAEEVAFVSRLAVLRLEPQAVVRVEPGEQESERLDPFVAAISEGLAALERHDYDTARSKFMEADRIRPGTDQVAEGLARAKMGIRMATIEQLHQQARQFESKELWHQAAGAYQRVLELDPAIDFANQGKQSAERKAAFYASMERLLAKPQRFTEDAVREEAKEIGRRAERISSKGPRLEAGLAQLKVHLDVYGKVREVVLKSDELTEIFIYKVKKLAPFAQTTLELRPATYTIVGSRKGYRDVRIILIVEPGKDPQPLTIKCVEKI